MSPASPPHPVRVLAIAAMALPLLGGCGVEEMVLEPFRGATPHERYLEALERSGLGESALALQWHRVAEGAFRYPVEPTLPFVEEGRFAAAEPTSLAYRFELRRGQRLQVNLTRSGFLSTGGAGTDGAGDPGEERDEATGQGSPGRVFVELFRLRDPAGERSPLGQPLLVAWTDPPADTLAHEARTTATYLLRIQPELLAEGGFSLEVGTGPSMAFPVEGRDTGHIQSRFGASRDGGRRAHHGVDIFAPRGTPVLAAGPGVVTRVRETPVGGRVVWVRDPDRGLSRYYAHLNTQEVEEGARISPGDLLGTVGNTGNARTTPPHLHFGLYVRGEGPVDPWDFLDAPGTRPRPLQVDPEGFLTWARLRDLQTDFRKGPGQPASPLELDPGAVRIVAGSGAWYRVRLADGQEGYIAGDRLDLIPRQPVTPPGVASRLPAETADP